MMNCNKCGQFMAKDGDEWDEYPLGPYVNQEWKCGCGNTMITSDDFRLRSSKGTARAI